MNYTEISEYFSDGIEAVTDGIKARDLYTKAMADGVMSESEAMIVARAVAEIFNVEIVPDEALENDRQAAEAE